MKLELKHLAPYIPYGLHIQHNDGARLIICGAFKKHNADDFFTYSLLNWKADIKSTDSKPILRPLSDFDKEIKIDKEIFMPCNYFIGDDSDLVYNALMHHKDFSYLPYNLVQKLFEWHFDVFGLIDAGLAIDINTLKQ